MGYEVRVVLELRAAPSEALVDALDHQFGSATHDHGSKIVTVIEHVAVPGKDDAIEFVRSLVLEAVPPKSAITEITAVEG